MDGPIGILIIAYSKSFSVHVTNGSNNSNIYTIVSVNLNIIANMKLYS